MKNEMMNAIRTALANATKGTLFRDADFEAKTIYIPVTPDYDPNDALFALWKLGEEVLGECIAHKGTYHKIILAL